MPPPEPSRPDLFPSPTWPEGMVPTIEQLDAWLRTFRRGQHDARIAADMILGMLAEERRSAAQELGSTRDALESALMRAGRYRVAWMAARRRSDQWRAITDLLIKDQLAAEGEV